MGQKAKQTAQRQLAFPSFKKSLFAFQFPLTFDPNLVYPAVI
jgi:hypothetical protein